MSTVSLAALDLVWELSEREISARFLIRDNDAKFSGAFDEVFRVEGVKMIRTPVEAPKAKGIAERFVGTVRRSASIGSWSPTGDISNEFFGHSPITKNGHRPHCALDLVAPDQAEITPLTQTVPRSAVTRRDRLGGLIHEYRAAA